MENNYNSNMSKTSYLKFAGMLSLSFVIMYFVMYMNVEELNHIYISYTRIYMTLLMVTPMALIMLFFMKNMYTNKKVNMFIIGGSITVFAAAFFMLRTQAFISDVQYMKGMIPHHSSAIMTSRHADIRDAEVRQLSEDIIDAQREEIALMKAALERLD